MTKKNNTSLETLIELKLKVIQFHQANEYTEAAIARDACYTSFNSIQYKKTGVGQMADVAGEIKGLMPERGSEIADVKIARLLDRHERMEEELSILEDRHEADKAVYEQITQEKWTPKPKRTHKSTGLGLDDRLKKFA